jgi:subtilisin family serine protease
VKVFVIDTGLYAEHQSFGGRATRIADFVGGVIPPGGDCNGHGTHVAGTVGGSTYGVAKGVTLYGVRVFPCSGGSSTAIIMAGVDYVTSYVVSGGVRPAVVNMSIQGPPDAALDAAVRGSIAQNITYAIAAGNSSFDASFSSPGRVAEALTVAASDINDVWAFFSNFGSLIDVIAPGVGVLSAGHTSPTATAVMDGTSMASPHVAGLAALYLRHTPPRRQRQWPAGWCRWRHRAASPASRGPRRTACCTRRRRRSRPPACRRRP